MTNVEDPGAPTARMTKREYARHLRSGLPLRAFVPSCRALSLFSWLLTSGSWLLFTLLMAFHSVYCAVVGIAGRYRYGYIGAAVRARRSAERTGCRPCGLARFLRFHEPVVPLDRPGIRVGRGRPGDHGFRRIAITQQTADEGHAIPAAKHLGPNRLVSIMVERRRLRRIVHEPRSPVIIGVKQLHRRRHNVRPIPEQLPDNQQKSSSDDASAEGDHHLLVPIKRLSNAHLTPTRLRNNPRFKTATECTEATGLPALPCCAWPTTQEGETHRPTGFARTKPTCGGFARRSEGVSGHECSAVRLRLSRWRFPRALSQGCGE